MPIKRHTSLQPLSRDHHHSLLLVWKIRQGLSKNISPERIGAYVKWFFDTHEHHHLETEEQYVLPLLDSADLNVQKVLKEHQQLRKLFAETQHSTETLTSLANLLEAHVRFEERILFNQIQENVSPEQLSQLGQMPPETAFCDNDTDTFWL